MISNLHALILGFIEGLTEFLPISSTGHLVLTNYFLGNDLSAALVQTFEISIQLGAILAVIGMYYRDFLRVETLRLLLYGFLPTAFIGLLAKGLVGTMLAMPIVVASALIIGGIGIILAEMYVAKLARKNSVPNQQIDKNHAFFLGLWQSLALIPGMSRSGSMIIGGLLMNINRETLVRYTFLIAVPTMGAATALSLKDSFELFTVDSLLTLAIGFITALITAFLTMRVFIPFIRSHTFIWFGVYRIAVGLMMLGILL